MMGQSRAVLIVEDDAELRSLMATLLEDGQRDIIEYKSAEEACNHPHPRPRGRDDLR
jgi:CheY-like chemotaxis protein